MAELHRAARIERYPGGCCPTERFTVEIEKEAGEARERLALLDEIRIAKEFGIPVSYLSPEFIGELPVRNPSL